MLRSLLISILSLVAISCASGLDNIQEKYYEIDPINGINKEEAITTAIYHASLDKIFKTTSEEKLSPSVKNKGKEWMVTLTHRSSAKTTSAIYLVNKVTGNATPLQQAIPPVNFASNVRDNDIAVKVTPAAKVKAPRATEFTAEISTDQAEITPISRPQNTANQASGNQSPPSSGARVSIDEDRLVGILSSNKKITKKRMRKTSKRKEQPQKTPPVTASKKKTIGYVDAFPRKTTKTPVNTNVKNDPKPLPASVVEAITKPQQQAGVNTNRKKRQVEKLSPEPEKIPAPEKRPQRETIIAAESITKTTTKITNPIYKLKLLTGGFEADLNNHIKLSPDHDMDFSEDIQNEVAGTGANASMETDTDKTIAKVTPAEEAPLHTPAIPDKPAMNTEPTTPSTDTDRASPAIKLRIVDTTKAAKSPDLIVGIHNDTITFRGVTKENKAILRIMNETGENGYRTSVLPVELNGMKITQVARLYEIPPGTYTVITRCHTQFDEAYEEESYSYDNKIEITLAHRHEYVLEASTYPLDEKAECAASIYDVRDARR